MASSPALIPLLLLFLFSAVTPCRCARLHLGRHGHLSTLKLTMHAIDISNSKQQQTAAPAQELFSPGVIRSSPARPMPSYNQNAAPVPLPEFPTLGPPIVWSFPAAPLPAGEEAPAPQGNLPAMPKTKQAAAVPAPCHDAPFPTPFVAAEPAMYPGSPLQAPEIAPEPTAGGPPPAPYY